MMARFSERILLFFFQVLFSTLFFFFQLFTILRHPFTVFKRKSRSIPPACLIDPSLGAHEYVTANGIKFHYVTGGDKAKPLMLFLHGFPEFWFSWRYQLKEFCDDYHVVAVDMRGYGDSDKPDAVGEYKMDILKEDVVQLIKVLGSDKCILVAHDWGGAIAWGVVDDHPELVDKLIMMNCPHSKVFVNALRKGWKQFLKSWYILMFQTPWLPEFALSLRDFGFFNDMFRGQGGGLHNKDKITDDIIEAYKYTFSQKGALTPPINYYRNIFQFVQRKRTPFKKIDVPTLLIWGEDDVAFDASVIDSHNEICTNILIHRIPQCSHFVQHDCPEPTNKYMREFLESQQ